MSKKQKINLGMLALVALMYFAAFAIPNATGAEDEHTLFLNSVDESFQYPNLIRMVTPGEDIHETRFRILSYGHYIYGYPFYVYSALVILPVRLIYGEQLTAHTQLNLLLLRQMVSVLPMILALLLLVYLQTRLQSDWRSLGLFVLLLSTPGVVRQNIAWWHPDAMAFLMVVLTFFFLDRDRLRFGGNFFLAAVSCGLATGIKVYGIFFFLAVAGYVLAGLAQRRIDFKKAVWVSLAFIVVLLATVVISNPLLLDDTMRAKIFKVHRDHQYYFTHGWDDSPVYRQGPLSWLPVITGWYGQGTFLLLALVSLAVAAWRGPQRRLNRLILAWAAPYAVYVFFWIVVRPDHYWLPVLLPVFSAVLTFTAAEEEPWQGIAGRTQGRWLRAALVTAAIAIIALQLVQNAGVALELFRNALAG